ncbi:MAG TPA: hypothetical protein VFT74_00770 [Isosphaeraceae bacterium]|nr:hypothetical protein [Isosphaeraceae bacterium]
MNIKVNYNRKPNKPDFPATSRHRSRTSSDDKNLLNMPLNDDPPDGESPLFAARGGGAVVAKMQPGDSPPGPSPGTVPSPHQDLNPFDPGNLRVSQDFGPAVNLRKILTIVPVRKPSNEWFVRTHPDPGFRIDTTVLELKEDREIYLVAPVLREALATEPTFSPRSLVWSVNRQGIGFLWPIRLPGPDGKVDSWSESAHEAAKQARTDWVRVRSNMALGAYSVDVASAEIPEPQWPDMALKDILAIAFRSKFIDTWEHPVLRRLRGEV